MTHRPSIIPAPVSLIEAGGVLRLNSPLTVCTLSEGVAVETIVDASSQMLRTMCGWFLHHAHESKDASIVLEHVDYANIPPNGYLLKVEKSGVRILALSDSGLFYGMQSLLQLIEQYAAPDEIVLPLLEIRDHPRFVWRGMHLDVSRHFFPVSFIKKYIDLLAFHKLNIFHWHLTDDQGWRIEIKRYPRLTDVGAWRNQAEGGRYGGFYTQDEISDIVRYASDRYVTIVPEIELPGHATAALAAYPEYSCSGGSLEVATTWGIFEDVYCAGKEETFEFLQSILDEVCTLFPGAWIHIGGDECPKERWKSHGLCQERMKQNGLHTEDDLQSYFIARIAQHLASRGKRLIGWDEILDGGAPDDSAIMAWRSVDKGIAAAQAGHDVVMCPMSHCYFDHYQAKGDEPKAIGGFTPLEKVYHFEPVPEDLPSELIRHIVGAQGNVWTEYMQTESHVEYMVFPRLCALSEVLWSQRDARSFPDFFARLTTHLYLLKAFGVNYRQISA